MLRILRQRADEKGRRLNLGWDRADEIGARDMDQLGNLLEADLRLAARDHRGHRLARGRPAHLARLAGDLLGDAELLEPTVERYVPLELSE
jgi:hypothetical protein